MPARARRLTYATTAGVWAALAGLAIYSYMSGADRVTDCLTDAAEETLYLLAAVLAVSSVLIAMLAPISAANAVWLQILRRPTCKCEQASDVRTH